ncbi:MAG TPA: hypothetical protein VFO31_24330 [Vicinamibacterales bacterium]|nr:hypothetical protein [Vicinamibacterales bacterium]
METLGEGLDAFESEICAHPVLEVVKAYPDAASRRAARATIGIPLTSRRPSSALVPEAHDDGPPVIRVAMMGVPRWARRVRVVPAVTLALWTAAGISVGAAHVLTLRVPAPVPAPPPAPHVSRPAAAPAPVTVIVESVPESPAKE